ADLKDSKITELLPGWWKAAGRATRVTFTVIDKPQVMRFDDIVIDGPGTLVKGTIELDANGEIALASFPSFALSDGDKATLRADRAPDGTLKVTMRGELFDGRGFIKSATSAPSAEKTKQNARDFDLDVKLATVTGYNVEALRGVELRMSRRNGHVRNFGMIAKLGVNSSLSGDLRAYPGRMHPLARQAYGARWRGVGPGDGRHNRGAIRLRARRRAHARHLRARLCAEQFLCARADRRPVPRRAERRRVRHDLRDR